MKQWMMLLMLASLALPGRAETSALFREHCQKCHGEDGTAHTVRGYLYFARNLSSPGWQDRRTDEDLFRLISNGPGWWSVMPGFKDRLSEAQRRELVQTVRGLRAEDVGR